MWNAGGVVLAYARVTVCGVDGQAPADAEDDKSVAYAVYYPNNRGGQQVNAHHR